MSRIIKFRAWNENIKWISKPFTFGQVLNFHDQIIKSLTKEEIIMQFTGLKDKNEVEIYEGDILRINLYDDEWKTKVRDYYGTLIIDVVGCDWDTTALSFLDDEAETEVIGNIYENSELLNS